MMFLQQAPETGIIWSSVILTVALVVLFFAAIFAIVRFAQKGKR